MTKLSDDLIRPRSNKERRNRDVVLDTIPIGGKGKTVQEIADQLGLPLSMVIACIWLDSAKLTPVHDPDNPIEIRWRRDE